MAMRKTKPTTAAQTFLPTRPTRHPEWYKRITGYRDVQHSPCSLGALIESVQRGECRLPIFQRPYVWTDEQAIKLFDSLWSGYHIGSLLLWEQSNLPASEQRFRDVSIPCPAGRGAIVVDGQQRLGAIVSVALSDRFFFDGQTGRLTTDGAGPWKIPAGYALRRDVDSYEWPKEHAAQWGLDEADTRGVYLATTNMASHRSVSFAKMGERWPLEAVIESYKRLNTEGTPMDLQHLEDGLRRARDGA